jgi:hypothetical protein
MVTLLAKNDISPTYSFAVSEESDPFFANDSRTVGQSKFFLWLDIKFF